MYCILYCLATPKSKARRVDRDVRVLAAIGIGGGDDGTNSASNSSLLWQISEHHLLVVIYVGRSDLGTDLAGDLWTGRVALGSAWVVGTPAWTLVLEKEGAEHRNRGGDHDGVVLADNAVLEDSEVVGKVWSIGKLSDFDGLGDRGNESAGE